MRNNRSKTASNRTNVLVVTADAEFEQTARATFAASAQIDLAVLTGTLAANEEKITGEDTTVIVIDLDATRDGDLAALTRLMGRLNGRPPVVVVTPAFERDMARQLLQMRVADFLVKPVPPVELVRTCARVVQTPTVSDASEAHIYTYLPAAGGAGVTMLEIDR
jgi:pilus assembly protein CpaE